MIKTSVKTLLTRIEALDDRDRFDLELAMAQRLDRAWMQESAAARKIARKRKIDDAAIQQAIERVRYGQ